MWPHKRREAQFTSHRLLLDKQGLRAMAVEGAAWEREERVTCNRCAMQAAAGKTATRLICRGGSQHLVMVSK